MRVIEHINFDWKFKADFDESYTANDFDDSVFETINIPHCNIILPYNNFDEKEYQFESCYRRKFIPSSIHRGNLIYLCFDGIMNYARIFINGKFAGEHKGGYTPFKLEISEFVLYDEENSITVYVDSRERKEIPPFGFVIDYLTYGGIYREARLEYCNDVLIENCHIMTTHVLREEKRLSLNLFLKNILKREDFYDLIISVRQGSKIVQTFKRNITLHGIKDEKFTFDFDINGVELWDIENPNLYTVKLELKKERELMDNKSFRFGFREIELTKRGFFLNGEKIKIRGLNRHQSFPYTGYAMPKSAQYKDAEILKNELGVNTVRLSHYPQSDHFLDRCDELGLLVFDEIPGWQHIGEKGEWWSITRQHVSEMIKKDWNHPSVFIWGVRINESQDNDELYTETNRMAKELDHTRPTGGVRCITGSHLLEDVYTYNDFIHNGIRRGLNKRKNVIKREVPYLVTEYNGHMFPTKKFDDTAHRVEQALRHLRVLDAMYADDEIAGCIGWCMFDYNTHKEFGSGDKICYHGVLDMFRIPKYAAGVYASQQDETPVMTVASSMENGDLAGSIRGDVYVFTNCDSVKLFINDRFIKEFTPRRDLFPNIPHPPILIDDFIGDQIKDNEKFSEKDSEVIKSILMKVNKTGGELDISDKMAFARLAFKYKMNKKDGDDLYSKYFAGWGSASTEYRFEGFKNRKCVVSQKKSQVFKPELVVEIDNESLIEETTYDTTRIVLKLKNEYDDDIIYSNEVFVLSVEGEAEIIGPRLISLIGGSRAFWIKSIGKTGTAVLKIESERFGTTLKTITIKKNPLNERQNT
ncbi:MAG TPA: glycoside hydrolase family 2 TIM barrel-domain containing protein [Thermotogota bacterium]|nr:glycoside hydrolase family 2 TIM barrel-domain containing protein [Thermotogota bacterium]